MDFKELNRQLKDGALRSIYVLYGSEDYLKDFYQKRLTDALVDPALETFNLHVLEGAECTAEAFERAADAYPFMAEKRLIILRQTGLFARTYKNADTLQAVSTCLCDMPDYLTLVFVEESVDRSGPLYQAAQEKAAFVELEFLKMPDLIAWISKQAATRGKKITRDAVQHLIDKCDSSLYAIIRELDKLEGYLGDRDVIRVEHIDAVVTKSLESRIFELVDFLAAGNKEGALRVLSDLRELRESEVKIAAVISQHYSSLAFTKLQLDAGVPQAEIAKKLKKRDFVIRKYAAQSRGMRREQLTDLVDRCMELDLAIKTSRYESGYFALEAFVLACPDAGAVRR